MILSFEAKEYLGILKNMSNKNNGVFMNTSSNFINLYEKILISEKI